MGGYMTHFIVYTMAMTGLICFAVFVYKKITDGTMSRSNNKNLSIEESMSISPRKTLHIVRAGDERFLIASDIDKTTLISKLEAANDIPHVLSNTKASVLPDVKVEKFDNYLPEKIDDADIVSSQKEIRIDKTPQVIHLETVLPERRRKAGAKRNLQSLSDDGISTMRQMAKRINEL